MKLLSALRRLRLPAAAVWLFLPSALVAAAGADAAELRLGVMRWFVTTFLFLILLSLLRRYVGRVAWILLLSAWSLYATLCILLAAYQAQFGSPIDIGFVLASPIDSLRTLLVETGNFGALLVLAGLLALMFLNGASLSQLAASTDDQTSRLAAVAALVLLLPAFFYLGAPHKMLLAEYALSSLSAPIDVPPILTDYSKFDLRGAGENVVLTQLESLNAIAVNGELAVNGHLWNGNYLPGTTQLRPRSIYFPYLWAHDVFTNHGQQSLLCGVIRNFDPAYYRQSEPLGPCLPELFRRAGYKTVFLSSYPDGRFYNTDAFMKGVGFEDIRFADFMQPGDPVTAWGSPEKIFLRRAYDYLHSHYKPDEKLFIYLAMCAHHAGFTRSAADDRSWFTDTSEKQISAYLASAQLQDASLVDLYNLNEQFSSGGRPTHLIVVPDHGFPLGLYGARMPQQGATIDNFLTTCLYIPPDSRRAEFAEGSRVEQIFGQSDLVPTIAELVTHKPHQNSFVPFIRTKPAPAENYEPCQVMTQPYSGGFVSVAHGLRTYLYSMQQHTITAYEIQLHPIRQRELWVRRHVRFRDFEAEYGCRRYRAAHP
ncbi:MAG: hypothetical protein QOI24_1201 [Acidobacteriota bacterium]|jgi:hypothetical protein|nr:hypothetical protein [Acidobacteriota bacterium]